MGETIQEIKEKNFINKEDLKTILGSSGEITDYMVKTYYAKIREIAVNDLNKKGLIIPKKTIIPAVYVWKYLQAYGITK